MLNQDESYVIWDSHNFLMCILDIVVSYVHLRYCGGIKEKRIKYLEKKCRYGGIFLLSSRAKDLASGQ